MQEKVLNYIKNNVKKYYVGTFFKCEFEFMGIHKDIRYIVDTDFDTIEEFEEYCVNDFINIIYNNEEINSLIQEMFVELELGY